MAGSRSQNNASVAGAKGQRRTGIQAEVREAGLGQIIQGLVNHGQRRIFFMCHLRKGGARTE